MSPDTTSGGGQGPAAGGKRGRAAGGTRRPAAGGSQRLARLLALIPYVLTRRVVPVSEAAAAFEVTERQLIDDLNLLWCTELQSPQPYCPIDLSYDGGEIVVSESGATGRPLRLQADEACALLVALRMFAELPGLAGSDALDRVIVKLERAAGDAAALAGRTAVAVHAEPTWTPVVRTALESGRRMHLVYYVPGRDENTERDVDPMRLLVVDGSSYLEGWCRRAESVRLFRLDRIVDATVLDVPARVPDDAEPVDVDAGLFRPAPDDPRVTLDVTTSGRWVAETYPCESVTELGEGGLRIVLAVADPEWMIRLALRLGDAGRVVAPGEVAAAVTDRARRALAGYEAGGHASTGRPAPVSS